MPVITLPDGSQRSFAEPVTVAAVAASISRGLAKTALAGQVNDRLVDMDFLIEADAELSIVTPQDDAGLDVIRHSCAHLMAQAVKSLFPEAMVTIGPVIEDGFYYDFSYSRPFTPDDLSKIERKMQQLVKSNLKLERKVMSRSEAIDLFEEMGESYKVEIIQDIAEEESLTAYQQGDFVDLCRGPHVPSTGRLKAFKLTKLAGAYWRGDSNNEMLQRIYGTAFADKSALDAHLARIEEAQKRDHRLLAKKMDLFHFQEEAPGMAFWHPKGWDLVLTVRQYMRDLLATQGYQEINTPQLVDESLWEASGHKAKFGDDMFSIGVDNRDYVVKPMNCPCHVQVFKQGVTSYRDLPVRLSEFGSCHRNEPSGTLHGLMRVRGFVQDDAHIFCREEQIQTEVSEFIHLLQKVYADFGFTEILYKLSTRPEKRIGSDEIWDRAEQSLADALDSHEVEWETLPGEGAFYGPKIEFSLRDCLSRVWQCGTVQLDFSMPERLGAHYIDEQGNKCIPAMIHRAILGSFERFIAIVLEHYAGVLPLWLAPTQVVVMSISDAQAEYATEITQELKKNGLKVNLDLRNEKIGYKIREHTIAKVPYLLILGDRERETGSVAVRDRNGETETLSLSDCVLRLRKEIETKGE